MTTAPALRGLDLTADHARRNLPAAVLVEEALARGEGRLASNGAFVATTGDRTGRSPKAKFLEDTPEIHANVWWGAVNQPMSPETFDALEALARERMASRDRVYVFDGFVGADPHYRLGVTAVSELAWHSLFARTLFLRPTVDELKGFNPDWVVLNCGDHTLTDAEQRQLGLSSPVVVAQSLTKRTVVIFGTEYAGEIKKSLFYAMNYDMPDAGVFPMHCSANVDRDNHHDAAIFFGLSGTGKTTLSADPSRDLVGDDEHGWSPTGVFNFEGGCYAKCIKLTRAGEPLIYDAIKFGSVLENVVLDDATREPDYDDGSLTENTRATYPVENIANARIPSVAGHPKNVIFLTADAFGVLPPVSRLTPEQAMYHFINGYTSKLAGTEAGITEPIPNFSPCFGGPFMPRPPALYAQMLADRVREHDAHVWLLNTGWTGGAYGVGSRFKLAYTRAMVTAILNGSLAGATFTPEPVFGLAIPDAVVNVPAGVLNPRDTWADKGAYDAQAADLAAKFHANDQKFEMTDAVRAAGPKA